MKTKYVSIIFLILLMFFASFSSKAGNSYLKINYGITSSNVEATAAVGTITTDSDDEGFMLSAGGLIGDFWGIDLMYYDLGDTKITVTSDDTITVNQSNFSTGKTNGDITRNTTGFGLGLIAAGSSEEGFLGLNYYLKLGIHAWDRDGSTTLLLDNDGFKSKYYTQGIGAYGGIGVALNISDNLSLDLAYDLIGISSNASFENNSTLASAGLRVKF